jgi:DMSO/TMAO reductase YedYZ molybdopterin-dependent catalytic subunit
LAISQIRRDRLPSDYRRELSGDKQITRHDCIERWSVIGKWRGVPLATVVAMAQPKQHARYIVFRCFDVDQSGQNYYESLVLHQAAHPQTILALDLTTNRSTTTTALRFA